MGAAFAFLRRSSSHAFSSLSFSLSLPLPVIPQTHSTSTIHRPVPLPAPHVLHGRLVLRRRRRHHAGLHHHPPGHDLGRRLPDRRLVVGRARPLRVHGGAVLRDELRAPLPRPQGALVRQHRQRDPVVDLRQGLLARARRRLRPLDHLQDDAQGRRRAARQVSR